jgi:hypothetical protein
MMVAPGRQPAAVDAPTQLRHLLEALLHHLRATPLLHGGWRGGGQAPGEQRGRAEPHVLLLRLKTILPASFGTVALAHEQCLTAAGADGKEAG